MVSFVPVFHLLGTALSFYAVAFLVPLATGWLQGEATARAYALPLLATVATGLALLLATRRATRATRRELQPRDAFLLVGLTWIVLPLFGALPFLLLLPDLSFTDAYFEGVSCLTTTGSTTLANLESLPRSLHAWRAASSWIGGIGVVVLGVAILPVLGVGGSQVFKTELPGPMKEARLTPRIAETAKALSLVYLALSALCVLALKWAGMSWFDALCHGAAIVSLGGVSTHDGSFAFFDSPAIEFVAMLFMMLAAINFATHFRAFGQRRPTAYLRTAEARWTVAVVVVGSLVVALCLVINGTFATTGIALRHAFFNTVSVATTAGFANTDFGSWPEFAPVFMLLLSCFATSSGSAGGGIKMIRAVLLVKQASREMVRIIHPRVVNPVRLDGEVVADEVLYSILAFMLVWGGTIIFLTIVLLFTGLDVVTAFTAIVSCVNNAGPGMNQVGPATTFAILTDFQTWICTAAMLLGRLELFTLLVVFTPGFWRK